MNHRRAMEWDKHMDDKPEKRRHPLTASIKLDDPYDRGGLDKLEQHVAALENLVRAAAPQIERSRTGYSLHDKQADEWLEWATSLGVLSPPSVREEPPTK